MGTTLATEETLTSVNEYDIPWYKLYAEHFKLLYSSEDANETLTCIPQENYRKTTNGSALVKDVADKNIEVNGDAEVATECTEVVTVPSPQAKTERTVTDRTKEIDNSGEFHQWVYVSKGPGEMPDNGCIDYAGYGITAHVLSEEDLDVVEKVEMVLENQNVVVHNVQISVDLSSSRETQSDNLQADIPTETEAINEIPETSEAMQITEIPQTDDVFTETTETPVESEDIQTELEETPGVIHSPARGSRAVRSSISFVMSPRASVCEEDTIAESTETLVECEPPEIVYDAVDYDVTEERQSVQNCISFWETKTQEDANILNAFKMEIWQMSEMMCD